MYGQRWLDGRKHWPAGTEFYWYTEGYDLPFQADELQMIEQAGTGNTDGWVTRKDCNAITDFANWKLRHAGYVAPSWKFEVVKFAHKMFAFMDATANFDGVGVWCDADCEAYRKIPDGLLESKVVTDYIAIYDRPGRWTETGFFIVNCAHPAHEEFWAFVRDVYLNDRYRPLHHWTDCFILDAAIKKFTEAGRITVCSLSGDKHKQGHPMAHTELGKYLDHAKGERKEEGKSPENKFRRDYEREARV